VPAPAQTSVPLIATGDQRSTADHGIQTADGKVRPDYLELLVGWATSRFPP